MPTFSQAITAFKRILNKLPLGAGNRRENKSYREADRRIQFIRKLRSTFRAVAPEKNAQLFYPKLYSFYRTHFIDDKLLDLVLISMLAKFVISGNCMEHSAIGFTEFLVPDFKGQVEYVQLISTQDEDSHVFLILNRDSKFDLNEPETWNKETIILDAWNNQVYELGECKEPISMLKLARVGNIKGNDEDLRLVSPITIDKPLSLADIDAILDFLEAFGEYVEVGGIALFKMIAKDEEVRWKELLLTVETFFASFKPFLAKEIQQYKNLREATVLHAAELKHAESLPPFEKFVEIPRRPGLFKKPIEPVEIELKDMKKIISEKTEKGLARRLACSN